MGMPSYSDQAQAVLLENLPEEVVKGVVEEVEVLKENVVVVESLPVEVQEIKE